MGNGRWGGRRGTLCRAEFAIDALHERGLFIGGEEDPLIRAANDIVHFFRNRGGSRKAVAMDEVLVMFQQGGRYGSRATEKAGSRDFVCMDSGAADIDPEKV